MPERDFLIFWIFLLYFSEFSCPGRVLAEFGTIISFFPFSAYLNPFWIEIMPERGFLIFWIFFLFFWNFLARVEYERNSGLKFFSLFLGLAQSVLIRNNAGINFFNFFYFFFYFFWNFLARVECERNSWLKFISLSRPILSHFG